MDRSVEARIEQERSCALLGELASYGWEAAAGIILISGLIAAIAALVISFGDEPTP